MIICVEGFIFSSHSQENPIIHLFRHSLSSIYQRIIINRGDSFFSKTLDMKFIFFLIYSSSIQKIQTSIIRHVFK
ncbi:hypothetical protein HanXRQr2_Chr08g0351311 [Helianthus annuus]|uniref:Uncharacterized protein n=1 Tax=Helianthus annuus TaxID=4232 RepID=A0A251UAR8_HELAN|nr:hypothetical protein HanXRQr2_Chr08g0351311 [Helianthus annuus]KAJ0902634.1 hypothetical protein HanPSC8_Chr08g0339331 [Helianthus annuus]